MKISHFKAIINMYTIDCLSISLADSFVSFDVLAFWDEVLIIVLSFVLFFAFLDILRFFQFVRHLANLLATIKHGAKALSSFCAIFMTVVIAFSIVTYLLNGSDIEGFKTVMDACQTLLSTMLGKFSKDIASVSESLLGSLFFILFSVLVTFILFDMFISVLNQTHSMIQKNEALAPYDSELMSHMKVRFSQWFAALFGSKPGMHFCTYS